MRGAVESGLLVKGGGHAMAAGLTIARERLGAFRAFLEEELGGAVEIARRERALSIDCAISAGGAKAELVNEIERAGPFGSGNPEPVFALAGHVVADASVVGAGHVRLRLESGDRSRIEAIAFRAAEGPLGKALLEGRGQRMHVAGSLAVDNWGGRERVQMRVLDAAPASPGT